MTIRAKSTRPKFARLPSIALLSIFIAATGCESIRTTETPFEIITSSESHDAPPLAADWLFAEGEAHYEIIRSTNAGATMTIRTERDGDLGTQTRTLDDGTVLSEQRFRINPDGSVAELGFRNHERDVTVDVNPNQKLWPIDGETQAFQIRLPRISNPDSIRERGTAKSTATIESIDELITPIGRLTAVRIKIVFESDLRAANAVRVTERWYTKELGLVAERYDETVRTLGIPVEQSVLTIVRTERP